MLEIVYAHKQGKKIGIPSICCANRYVIEALLEEVAESGGYALIESTANQVNQTGGYTGMYPKNFVDFVSEIAKKKKFPYERLIFGGDHLGPLVWQNRHEDEAMEKACILVEEYIKAGFSKIHIDTSMRLLNDNKNIRLSDDIIAKRAVRLIKVAESAYKEIKNQNTNIPVYVIGSEVPIPGGAQENNEAISITTPKQMKETYETFKEVFIKEGLEDVFQRVIAIVIQPGVEFSDTTVTEYDRNLAKPLISALKEYSNLVYEGHSTDYQTTKALKQMVGDGIAILKVGPALTYALRQALFALNDIEKEVLLNKGIVLSELRETLEEVMLSKPENWEKYYHGNKKEQALKRKYSFSDRCRYYLPENEMKEAIKTLIYNINSNDIPMAVIEQFLPKQYEHYREGKIKLEAEDLIKDRIRDYIHEYILATKGGEIC